MLKFCKILTDFCHVMLNVLSILILFLWYLAFVLAYEKIILTPSVVLINDHVLLTLKGGNIEAILKKLNESRVLLRDLLKHKGRKILLHFLFSAKH